MKYVVSLFTILLFSCQQSGGLQQASEHLELDDDFKNYWFDGTAELSSFQLTQSRYGEPRTGTAVLIYVTEDFLADQQVKANQKSNSTNLVLKLNRNKNFTTGIYPYSIMNSSFTKLKQATPLVKITTSIQEWCGQTYFQLNRKNNLKIVGHSYFEGEGDQSVSLKDALTEDELWHWIRTQPERLPTGEIELLPAFEFIRLKHQPLGLASAVATLETPADQYIYHLTYPDFARKLSITFEKEAPHKILAWTEENLKDPSETTSAIRIKTLKLPYWKLNHLGDERFRDSLGLN